MDKTTCSATDWNKTDNENNTFFFGTLQFEEISSYKSLENVSIRWIRYFDIKCFTYLLATTLHKTIYMYTNETLNVTGRLAYDTIRYDSNDTVD